MPAWTPALSTGDAKIDDQHREIFRRFDLLHAALLDGERAEAARLYEFLGSYVGEHFAAEERSMRTSGYAHLEEHRRAHAGFVREYLAVGKALEAGGPSATVALKLSNWLASWLQGHILLADVELARHLLRLHFVLDEVT